MSLYLIELMAAVVANFIKGFCGFGDSLVFSTALSFFMDNVLITPIHTLLGFLPNPIIVFRKRKLLRPKIILPMTAIVLAGDIPGILLLRNLDSRILRIVFGAVVIILSLDMLRKLYVGSASGASKLFTLGIGLFSGLGCGLFSVGAPLSAYMSRVTSSGDEFKANLCFVFMAESIIRIPIYFAIGIITLSTVKTAAMLLPGMLLGLWLGLRCAGRIDEKKAKLCVIALLIISGAALIVKSL